jgi:hypothetical protein
MESHLSLSIIGTLERKRRRQDPELTPREHRSPDSETSIIRTSSNVSSEKKDDATIEYLE